MTWLCDRRLQKCIEEKRAALERCAELEIELAECQTDNQRLSQQLGWFKGSVTVETVEEEIMGSFIHGRFRTAFPNATLYPLDGKYRATNMETCQVIIVEFNHTIKLYILHYRDCENFALDGKSHFDMRYALNQMAVNYSRVHGFCSFFFLPDYEIKLWEPQGTRIFNVSEAISHQPSVEMPELVWIAGLRKWMRMDEAIREGMYDTVFVQV